MALVALVLQKRDAEERVLVMHAEREGEPQRAQACSLHTSGPDSALFHARPLQAGTWFCWLMH